MSPGAGLNNQLCKTPSQCTVTEVQKGRAKAAIHAYQLLVAGTVDKKPAHRNVECSTNLGTLP